MLAVAAAVVELVEMLMPWWEQRWEVAVAAVVVVGKVGASVVVVVMLLSGSGDGSW